MCDTRPPTDPPHARGSRQRGRLTRSTPRTLCCLAMSGRLRTMDSSTCACSDHRMRFDVDTKASAEQVRRALTDFTDRRLQIWNRTLDPKKYELREQGDTWAVARESSPGSPFWVVARYDWSEAAVIRWTVVESSYGAVATGPYGFSRETMEAAGSTSSGSIRAPASRKGRCCFCCIMAPWVG